MEQLSQGATRTRGAQSLRRASSRVTRRDLLLSGAAAALMGGCAGPIGKLVAPAESGTSAVESASVSGRGVKRPLVGLVVNVPSAVFQTMQAELRTAVPQLQVSKNSRFGGPPSKVPPPDAAPSWWIEAALIGFGTALGADPNAVSLGPALSLANFTGSSLLPGALAAVGNLESRLRDQLMPTRPVPLLVRYKASAFRAAGVELPQPGWTIDDFTRACTLLQDAITSGRLKALGVDQVLYPLSRPGGSNLGNQYQTATLRSPLLWEAFILGYGGAIVEGGTAVHWDTGPAFQGIATLMDIFRRFAGGPAPKPNSVTATEQRSAMRLVYVWYLLPPDGATGLAPGFAPFPQLPVHPSAPSDVQGVQLLYENRRQPRLWGSVVPQSAAGEEAAAAQIAVRYLTWLYAGPPQALLASAGVPPITVEALSQAPFWHKYGLGGPGVDVQFPYPWAPQANWVLGNALGALAESYLNDPASLKGQLRVWSANLTSGLAAANANQSSVVIQTNGGVARLTGPL